VQLSCKDHVCWQQNHACWQQNEISASASQGKKGPYHHARASRLCEGRSTTKLAQRSKHASFTCTHAKHSLSKQTEVPSFFRLLGIIITKDHSFVPRRMPFFTAIYLSFSVFLWRYPPSWTCLRKNNSRFNRIVLTAAVGALVPVQIFATLYPNYGGATFEF
jgi:hypothetical protein